MTSRCVAQLMMYPCTTGPLLHAVAHGKITLRQWQGSRVFMRERRVLKRVKWFIGPSRQFVRLLPLHIHANPLQLQTSPSGTLTILFFHIALPSDFIMDRGSVHTLHVFPQEEGEDTNLQVQKQLETFILEFRLDNVFVYRYAQSLRASHALITLADSYPETSCARMRSFKNTIATSTSAI